MLRGTFANVLIKNLLVSPKEGGLTIHQPSGEEMTIYDASMRYRSEGVPLVILAGTEYGTGSSRDWAAKGTLLMGVKAVIAKSFERIHRSNLVGMGVLPLQFKAQDTVESLKLDGTETFDLVGLENTEIQTCRLHHRYLLVFGKRNCPDALKHPARIDYKSMMCSRIILVRKYDSI